MIARGTVGALVVIAGCLAWYSWSRSNSNRPGGNDCGQSVNVLASYDPGPTNCLWNNYLAHQPAHADMTNYTTEGDPVEYIATIGPSSAIGIAVLSRDRYGPQGTFQYSCSGLSREPAPLTGRYFLMATGCVGPPEFLDGSRLMIP